MDIPGLIKRAHANAESKGWHEEQGVEPGAYPVEWDGRGKCLYLSLTEGITKKSRRDQA